MKLRAPPKVQAATELRDMFLQFSRNGRCGTCSGCPRTSNGSAFPEFCENTDRYDHQLTIESLAFQFNHRVKTAQHAEDAP